MVAVGVEGNRPAGNVDELRMLRKLSSVLLYSLHQVKIKVICTQSLESCIYGFLWSSMVGTPKLGDKE